MSVRFAHFPLRSGRVTAAFVAAPAKEQTVPALTEVVVAFSFCSPHDQFRKDLGRTRALTRLASDLTAFTFKTTNTNLVEDVVKVAENVSRRNSW